MSLVLLVEDSKSDEKLALLAMARAEVPAEVVVAHDGQEALEYLLGPHPSDGAAVRVPALVLLDLNLPRLSGLDVLRRLRADARMRRLPIVVLTSSIEERDVLQCRDLGANAYVRKPFGFDELATTMNTLLVFWLRLNAELYIPARAPGTA